MKKIYPFAVLVLVIGLLSSCKSQLVFEEHTYMREQSGRAVPYELATPSKDSKRMVVFLKDNPDTMQLKETKMTEYFKERDYNIVIPGKPGQGDQQKRAMDKKLERVNDVTGIIQELDSLRKDDLILVGFGEGGYLVPAVAQNTRALAAVVVNAGPNSMLTEFELMAKADTVRATTLEVLEEKNISDQSDLYTRVQNIKEDVNGPEQISPASNYYWMSYYENPVLEDINNFRQPLYFVVSRDYPLLSVDSRSMLRAISKSYTNMEYESIEGKGAFGNEEQMTKLVEQMDLFLMKRLSY